MKIAVVIARILMGVVFVFFGLNGFLQFLKAPLPTGLAG
jgi:putative oxidoreductase